MYFLLQYLNKKYAKELEENPSVLEPFYRARECGLKILGTMTLIESIIAWVRGI